MNKQTYIYLQLISYYLGLHLILEPGMKVSQHAKI